MENLLDQLRACFTPEIVQNASGLTGEHPAATGNAFMALAPLLLSVLAHSGARPSGAQLILVTLNQFQIDSSALTSMAGALAARGTQLDHMLQTGGALCDLLLCDQNGAVASRVADMAGVKQSSAVLLKAMTCQMLAALMSKLVGVHGLSPAGLANLLNLQKEMISASLPASLAAIVQLCVPAGPGMPSRSGTRYAPAAPAQPAPVAATPFAGAGKWILILFALALVFVLLRLGAPMLLGR